MSCKHRKYTTETRGFSGPVSRIENRAAHGNVCHTDKCDHCGAERRCNVNGRHVEFGQWTMRAPSVVIDELLDVVGRDGGPDGYTAIVDHGYRGEVSAELKSIYGNEGAARVAIQRLAYERMVRR